MKVMTMTAFTVRVPDETANRLDQLAEKLDPLALPCGCASH